MDREPTRIRKWTQLLKRHPHKLNQPYPPVHELDCLGLGRGPVRPKQLHQPFRLCQ
jgi:hypothetical protein